jgi:hypothetical protein
MSKFVWLLLSAIPILCIGLSAGNTSRYFKEDHLTGADYIALAPDGSYTLTGLEHMGVSVEESGRWSKSEKRITFTPKKSAKSPYTAEEVTYKQRTFLSLEGDSGPSIPVPINEIERDLDKRPKTLPPYVFFEISATVYQQETKQQYPFRAQHPLVLRLNLGTAGLLA